MKVYALIHPVVNRLLSAVVLAILASASPAFAQSELITVGSSWKYLDDGDNLGARWYAPNFDETGWKTGNAKLGYGNGDEATEVDFGPFANHKHITTYFRKSFTVANPAAVGTHTLRLRRADGAVVYVNGQEVFRTNMPTGRVGYVTLAAVALSPAEEAAFVETTSSANVFVPGLNSIAVEVHKNNGSGAVLSFDLSLTAGGTAAPPVPTAGNVVRGPYLQMGTPNSVIIRWRTDVPTDSRVIYGDSPNRLNFSTSNPTLTTEHSITLAHLAPNTKYNYAVGTSAKTLAGGDDSYAFVTAPTTAKPTRIWVLGDAGTYTDDQRRVRDAYAKFTGTRATDLWLMLGDNAYVDGKDEEYQRAVFDLYPTFLRQSVLWPTIGNHDTAGSINPPDDLPYYQMFTLPRNAEAGGLASGTEDYYSFDYGNIHFVCLDSMTNEVKPDSPMLRWLTNDLAANTKQWLIAYWHHPPYTKGSHNSDAEYVEIAMREHALPILESYGVDLVLTGHSHSYERSFLLDGHYGFSGTFSGNHKKNGGSGRPTEGGAYTKPTLGPSAHEGAVYVVAGSSGQATGGALNHPAMFISLNNLGSMVLDVNANRLDAKFLRDTGAVADSFTIIKGSTSIAQASNTSAASYVRNHIAVEGLVSAFGASLCSSAKAATGLPLPTTLNGVSVKVKDAAGQERVAPLLFVSPGQINYQIPPGTVAGSATVTISNADAPVATETISISLTAPGLFTADASGKGWAAASIQRVKNGVSKYEPIVSFNPAQNQFVPNPIDLSVEGEDVFLLLYGTGIRHRGALPEVKVLVDGVETPVIFAGTQGQYAGLDQINIQLPRALSGRGEVTVTLVVQNKTANQVKIKIK